ncbi:MAG: glycosyltransferase, partial [Gammaproteobacteria bacterium]|nr:glycosyltransferase [Gammaproteobacteria bacterium]
MAPGACCQVCVVLNDEPDTPDARRILERLDTDASGYAFALCRVLGHGNVGFGRGHNLALAHSPAHHHLILNADVVLSPDYIVEHMRFMQAHADVVLLTPQGFGLRDEPLYLAKRYPSWTVLLGRFVGERRLPSAWARRLAHYRYADQGVPAQAVDIDIASGCCMFVRGEALRQCGGFDERYFLYFEDFDLSLR